MKVMITGASGLLGRALHAEYSRRSWEVLGLAFTRVRGDLVQVNLLDFPAVRSVIQDFKPDVIIHSAAERFPEKVEKFYGDSYSLNVKSSQHLAEFAKEVNAAFLYISTDYVFDGKNPPFKETDTPNPINKYGITKFEGEKAVMIGNPDSCILRVPVLYGGEEYVGESSVSSLLNILFEKKPASVSNYEIRFPALTSDIAEICFQLMDKKLKDGSLNSVFHWCGEDSLTKFEIIIILAKAFNLPHPNIFVSEEVASNSACNRPLNTELSCERLKGLGIGKHTCFLDGIKYYEKFLGAYADA